MTISLMPSPLWDLDQISLPELTERAALQTRIDRKYVLPTHEVDTLLTELGPRARVLEIDGERSFAYQSVYFDTLNLLSYRAAALKRRRRFKIRTRSYLDSSLCWLEVKTRGTRGSTVKNRMPYRIDDHGTVAPGRRFVNEILEKELIRGAESMLFIPTLINWYRRSTLYLPEPVSRVTIDNELQWEDRDGRCQALRGLAVVETKTGSTAGWVDQWLWARGHRPARISKYATCLAALRPDLPRTRWRKTLRRYFAFQN